MMNSRYEICVNTISENSFTSETACIGESKNINKEDDSTD